MFFTIDSTLLCPLFRSLAPFVNASFSPDLLAINPTYGDLIVLGFLVYDCPPYVA